VPVHFNVLEEDKRNRKKEGKFPRLFSTILSSTSGIILIKKFKIYLHNVRRLFIYLEDYKNIAYSYNNTVFLQTLTFYAFLYLYNLDNYTFLLAAPFCTPTAREHCTPVILQTETRPSCAQSRCFTASKFIHIYVCVCVCVCVCVVLPPFTLHNSVNNKIYS